MIIHLRCNNCEKCIPYISTPQHKNKIWYSYEWHHPQQDIGQTMWVYDEIVRETYVSWKVAVDKIQGIFTTF
jgi:hypothetical protein